MSRVVEFNHAFQAGRAYFHRAINCESKIGHDSRRQPSTGNQIPPERTLAETLSVGRSSVREALQILSTLNVIHVAPGSGAFVKEPRASDVFRPELIGLLIGNSMVRELPEAREMIEPSAARLACLRGTHADFSLIEDALENHELALITGQPINAHVAEFHVLGRSLYTLTVAMIC